MDNETTSCFFQSQRWSFNSRPFLRNSLKILSFSSLVKGLEHFNIIQIACGYQFFMALTEDGKVFVMGVNEYGQLGLGISNHVQTTPAYLRSLQGIPVRQIACGAYHSLVLTSSGNIFAFGRNK
jgi:E3 ubiquitin-protein ligase HERC4